jgi:hypothetical protein
MHDCRKAVAPNRFLGKQSVLFVGAFVALALFVSIRLNEHITKMVRQFEKFTYNMSCSEAVVSFWCPSSCFFVIVAIAANIEILDKWLYL